MAFINAKCKIHNRDLRSKHKSTPCELERFPHFMKIKKPSFFVSEIVFEKEKIESYAFFTFSSDARTSDRACAILRMSLAVTTRVTKENRETQALEE